jgi:hypothetical protein
MSTVLAPDTIGHHHRCDWRDHHLPTERRRARRASPIEQPGGSLSIQAADLLQQVRAVQDISPYGICVLVEQAIDSGLGMTLSYQNEELELNIVGSTVWCSRLDDPAQSSQLTGLYRVGLAFDQGGMEQNTRLFRALVEHR